MRALAVDEWRRWRALRLEALAGAPHAFCSTYGEWADADERRWRERLERTTCNLVAELDGVPAGMVTVDACDEPDVCELISMWVSPRARGRGVGEALVLAALARARDAGARVVRLDVVTGNAHAVALYARLGFVDAGESAASRPGKPQRRMRIDASASVRASPVKGNGGASGSNSSLYAGAPSATGPAPRT